MISIVLQYLSNPAQAIETYRYDSIVTSVLLTFSLITLSFISFFSSIWMVQVICCFFGLATLIFFESCCIDFIVQCFRARAQSLRAFQWLTLSYLPFVLCVPFGVLASAFPSVSMVFYFILFSAILFLKIVTISTLYKINKRSAILCYLVPIMGIPVFLTLFGASLFQLMMVSFEALFA